MENINASFKWKFFFSFWKKRFLKKILVTVLQEKKKSCFQMPVSHCTIRSKEKKEVYLREE